MTQQAHSERSHAELGASVAARWMACPGSIQLSRRFPVPPSTAFAQEGTAAHELADRVLTRRQDPTLWLGMTLEGVEVTEAMCDYVRAYTDHCLELAAHADRVWIEHKFNLNALNPPGPMYGTNDFAAYHAATRTLYVRDLKYGQGVVVEAKGNKQLRYYALGAILSPDMQGLEIDAINIGIVQPRAQHPDGIIRYEVLTLDELLGFTAELLEAARETQAPNPRFAAGSHCRFCPASGGCPEQQRQAQETAMVEFGAMPTLQPPDPAALTPAVFDDLMGKLHILEDFVKAVREQALRKLTAGEPVAGFKLVQKRPTRKWVDEEQVAEYLKAMGEPEDALYDRTLKSPAQMEKLLGKKQLPTQFVQAVSSGLSMVPASDPRPAVTPGEEFPALVAG